MHNVIESGSKARLRTVAQETPENLESSGVTAPELNGGYSQHEAVAMARATNMLPYRCSG